MTRKAETGTPTDPRTAALGRTLPPFLARRIAMRDQPYARTVREGLGTGMSSLWKTESLWA